METIPSFESFCEIGEAESNSVEFSAVYVQLGSVCLQVYANCASLPGIHEDFNGHIE